MLRLQSQEPRGHARRKSGKVYEIFEESQVGQLLPDGKVTVNWHLPSAWGIGHLIDSSEARRCPRKVLLDAREDLGLKG